MRILVFSDSHSALSFMRLCIARVKPDAVVHLGDHYDDAAALAEENRHLIFHQVPGNCDRGRCRLNTPQILNYPVCGVRLYMTHGHLHSVKSGIGGLVADARRSNAQAVLYGHTHRADCHQEPDGLWVLNPGSCGYYGGTAGMIETDGQRITKCCILAQDDLEERL